MKGAWVIRASKNWRRTALFAIKIFLGALLFWLLQGTDRLPWNAGSLSAQTISTVAQGKDFATLVLRTPWDMSQFSQISQVINLNLGNYMLNMQNSNGVFSANIQGPSAYFFLLYAGESNSIKVGKLGALYPIPTTVYKCLYLAMNLQSPQVPDQTNLQWGPDEALITNGGSAIRITENNTWKLYKTDLSNPYLPYGTAWTSMPQVPWLRIMPSTRANSSVSVDWVRLTDCQASNFTLTGLQSGTYSISVVGSSGRQIRVVDSFTPSSGQYNWDVQGLDADTYTYYVKNNSGTIVQQGQLKVNATPIVEFVKPSPTSGADYATQAGNPWDFSDPADIPSVVRASVSYSNGLVNVTSPSGDPVWGADPILYLNMPHSITNAAAYRYLSYRINTQWPWQDMAHGMLVRWIWGIPGGCDLVSSPIPFDVGWQTYWIDFAVPFNNNIISKGDNCPANTPTSWSTTPEVLRIRFDPNENCLGQDLFQQIDWVYLTQVDQATRATPFPIQISLNKPPQGIAFNYYYTTNPQQPTQHVASQYAASPPPPAGSHRLYLPLTLKSTNLATSSLTFLWNTSSVTPGTYFICVAADDTKNQATYCSDAPVQVN